MCLIFPYFITKSWKEFRFNVALLGSSKHVAQILYLLENNVYFQVLLSLTTLLRGLKFWYTGSAITSFYLFYYAPNMSNLHVLTGSKQTNPEHESGDRSGDTVTSMCGWHVGVWGCVSVTNF